MARLEVPDLADRLAQKRAEIAEGEARLALAEAGPRTTAADAGVELRVRPAERAMARASVARLSAELAYLEALDRKQWVCNVTGGVVVTPHPLEQIGRFLHEGDLIATVEGEPGRHIEVAVPEQEVGRVRPGQSVEIKIRALPFETLRAVVEQVGAAAAPSSPPTGTGASAGTQPPPPAGPAAVTVYCRVVGNVPPDIRPGMTGDARIACGRRSLGAVLGARFLRLFRTEFWW